MLSARAKSVIAGMAFVVIGGIQAWQVATVSGFRPVDLLPVATAAVAAILTHVVPNVPELPWAKSVVHAALGVLTALSTFVGSHSAGVTAANLLTVAAGAVLVAYVPELDPTPAVTGQRAVLAALADVPASPAAVQHLTQPILPDGPASALVDTSLAELSATAPAHPFI